jgi:Mg-chelatase subunit ChlD/tetratricopeptide (TPR) repeat protein
MKNQLHTTPDEHLEARITAWVLGQASPFEVAELEALCAEDPALQSFYERTKELHTLLLETPPSASDQFWKLSKERRAKLDHIIGPQESTLNKDSSIRRAGFRAAFGIAAVLTVTMFTTRYFLGSIGAPMASDSNSIESIDNLDDEKQSSYGPVAAEETLSKETTLTSKSKDTSLSFKLKPSASPSSSPAFSRERAKDIARVDSNMVTPDASRTADASNGRNAKPAQFKSNSDDLTKSRQAEKKGTSHRAVPIEESDEEIASIPAPNVNAPMPAAKNSKQEVNDGGIGYGRTGDSETDLSNTYLALEALSRSRNLESGKNGTPNTPSDAKSKPSTDFGDGRDFGQGWEFAEGKGEGADAFAANDKQNKGGFKYEPGASKQEFEKSFRSKESASNDQSAALSGKKAESGPASPPAEGARYAWDANSAVNPTTAGNRSGDEAIRGESLDAILNNPDQIAGNEINDAPAKKTNAQNSVGQSTLGGESLSGGSLAQREIARRQNNVAQGDEALLNGREAYAKGDYAEAANKYKEALSALPDTPALADRRESYSQHLSDASVAQAQHMRKAGKFDEARKLIEQAEANSPQDATIKNELAYLNDPIRTSPALTYEHVQKVDDVRRSLYKAQGNYDLGKYDDAKKEYESALQVDPNNQAARRGLEKVNNAKSDYYRAAYDQTGGGLLMEVDKAWELSVPAEGKTNGDPFANNKPTDEQFQSLTASSFSQLSSLREGRLKQDLSSLLDADVAGGQENNSAPVDDVGILNTTTRSGAEKGDISVIREFQYPTEYETPLVPGNVNPALSDPFASFGTNTGSGETFKSYLNSTTNVEKSLNGIDADFDGFVNYGSPIQGESKQVDITTKFIEITQGNNKELGFDWVFDPLAKADVGKLNIPVTPATPSEFETRLTDKELEVDGDKVPLLGDLPQIGKLFKQSLIDLSEEISAEKETFSTFSLNISDASFQLALAAIEKGERPDPTSIKPEQFYNAVDYGDPAPSASEPVAAAIDQTAHPVIPGRNLVRVALRTGSTGRSAAQPLRLTLLVDQSGSMVRADRRIAMETALAQLATLLTENDQITVIGFSRTPHLLAQSLPGNQAAKLPELINQTASEGGTNLEQAINLATEQALSNHLAGAQNRIVLFTDGAANLGDADPDRLSEKIKNIRQQGLAFDIAGIGTNDLNDRLLSDLARHGNGRYYLVGEKTVGNFAAQLAGAFRPAAENVKVQVKLNPQRVGNYKLIGFEKDRLKTEDFRNDAVDAAELAADEAGVALYQVETLPQGTGEIGEVSVRFRDTASGEMVERTWTIPYDASAPSLDKANPKTQLATLALLAAQKLQPGPMADSIDFSNYSETIAKLKQANTKSAKTQQLFNLINALK